MNNKDNNIMLSNKIIVKMSSILNEEQLDYLSNIINVVLGDCVVIMADKECDTIDDTFNIIEKFIDFKRTYKISEKTLKAYKFNINKFFTKVNMPLKLITEDIICEYLRDRQTQVSAVTADNERLCLSTFFKWCFDYRYIKRNPCTQNLVPSIKKPKTIRHDIDCFDMEKIRDSAREEKDTFSRYRAIALIDFLESTGCRCNEVSKCKIEDIDWQHKRIRVHGKGDKERYVPMNARCIKHIKEFLDYKIKVNRISPYIFSSKHINELENPLNNGTIEKITKRIGSRVGINRLTIHIFRRYFATHNHNRGVPPDTLRVVMGHTEYQTTLKYIDIDVNNILMEFNKFS